jgi:CheY-like chemotaxis protein
MLDAFNDGVSKHPCLILAHPDSAYCFRVERAFRRLGWDVYQARNGPEVRRLVPMLGADLVVLDADLPGESGWLTCEKLTCTEPLVAVILVTGDPGPRNHQFADFVGARRLIGREDGLEPLLQETGRLMLPAAG